ITAVSGEPEMDTQRILNQLGNISGNCLLVIDNADDRLQPYRAHLPRDWQVLITSREALGFSAAFDLDFLSETDAVALFYVHYDHQPDDALVLEIVKTVEFHTLTIELLAKTAARKKRTLPLDKLWQSIQQGGLQLGKVINITIPHSHHENIEKIFPYLCSIFELQHLSEQENELLKQFVCLPPTFHAFDELKNFLQIEQEESVEQLEDSLRQLKEKGWLLADQAADAYKMHRIVLDVVRTKLHIEEQHVAELLAQLIKLTDYHAGQNPVEKFPLIPYGKHLLTVIGSEYSESTGRLYNNIGLLYRDQGRYEEALTFFQKAIEISEAVLDAKHPDLAISYNNIGSLYQDQGRYEEALTFFQKAIEIFEASLGREHPHTQTVRRNLEGLKTEIKEGE
ncbi:MAG: tetratricopeptide repeat protein, partial [Lewinella sp.]